MPAAGLLTVIVPVRSAQVAGEVAAATGGAGAPGAALMVTGVAAGVANISYTATPGGCYAYLSMTVVPLPAAVGTSARGSEQFPAA